MRDVSRAGAAIEAEGFRGFGRLLRRYRQAAGFTQEELAERAGLSREAITALERGSRRAPYRATMPLLADALGLDAEERDALERAVTRGRGDGELPRVCLVPTQATRPIHPASDVRHNLPIEVTSFVGRQRELDELRCLLDDSRLVTLAGPGGSGKTRLALKLGFRELSHHGGGVWFADLSSLTDDWLVLPAVTAALGLAEVPGRPMLDALTDALAARDLLLILDNCEHVRASVVRLLDHLITRCPRVRFLATSRERLNLSGEVVWRLPPLSLPPLTMKPSTKHPVRSDAVELFLQRAKGVAPDFRLTDENVTDVVRICRELDGLALAIELAAARVSIMSPRQIADRLDDRFRVLAASARNVAPRHQTLRAALDWSYELLDDEERRLFARLSVFQGGWSIEAAEAICGDASSGAEVTRGSAPVDSANVLDLLSALVDKSLVQVTRDVSLDPRFGMIETIRRYGQEQLRRTADEAETIGERHAAYFLHLVEATPYWEFVTGPDQDRLIERLQREHDNLRAALRWLIDHAEVERAARFAGALGLYWFTRGHLGEGRAWCAELLATPNWSLTAATHAGLLMTAGMLAMLLGDRAGAAPLVDESLARWRRLGRPREEAYALEWSGIVALQGGDFPRARNLFEQALAVSLVAPNPEVEGLSGFHLGVVALETGDDPGAFAYARKALEIADRIDHRGLKFHARCLLGELSYGRGDLAAAIGWFEASVACARNVGAWWLSWALARLAATRALRGEMNQAREAATESLELARGLGDRWGIARAVEVFAILAQVSQRPERALRLAASALALRSTVDTPRVGFELRLIAPTLAAARAALGPVAGASEACGLGRSFEDTIADALKLGGPQSGDRRQGAHAALTPREREVLRFLAEGRSNREIAADLVIGERTVETHVTSILGKLGLRSRAQVAHWAVEHEFRTTSP